MSAHLCVPGILELLADVALQGGQPSGSGPTLRRGRHPVPAGWASCGSRSTTPHYEASVDRDSGRAGREGLRQRLGRGHCAVDRRGNRLRAPRPGRAEAADEWVGVADARPSSTWCGWSPRDWPTRTSPPGFSSHRGPCIPTCRTSIPSSRYRPACSLPKPRRSRRHSPRLCAMTASSRLRSPAERPTACFRPNTYDPQQSMRDAAIRQATIDFFEGLGKSGSSTTTWSRNGPPTSSTSSSARSCSRRS